MKPWGFLILASLAATQQTFAQDLSIVDVRRNITLADDDVVYKDFYISGGESDGLKKNLVVTAMRKIQVRDANGSQSYGEILIPVGQLRVIATYGKVSVAREYKLLSRDELPMLEQIGMMNGDRIDLKGAFVDNAKPVYKKKTAEHVAKPETAVVAVVTAPVVPTAAPAPAMAKGPAPASLAPEAPKTEKTAEAAAPKIQ
ncbi:MAG: hypothetical protein JSU04_07090 [Bdellovibrionales bacterium]|nr:hypothetical protein [Bdellovibrionales bacterium]